jgi:hypothetical protein
MDAKGDSFPIKFLKDVVKKGSDFAHDFWEATKREGTETKIAVLILRKMIQDKPVSQGEINFLKEHSMDLVKIIPLVLISGIPIPVPITPLLIALGKKYGFDLLPKDNRHHLTDKDEKEKEI